MVKNYLSLIKFSHTIFALPFALVGCFMGFAMSHVFEWDILVMVVLCMIFARSAAMTFNRWIDRDIDSANPRTIIREIPAGIVSEKGALTFMILNCVLFIGTTYFINPLCFYLSPVALLVILGYSFTKRFTVLCHLVLGLGLSLAPVGAFIAVTGKFDLIPILMGVAVLLWVSGFDIIYALQDQAFDIKHKLYSIPSSLGTQKSLFLARVLHLLSAFVLSYATWLAHNQFKELDLISYAGLAIFLSMLIYQHSIISTNDLTKINLAFFTTNGIASVFFGTLLIADFLL